MTNNFRVSTEELKLWQNLYYQSLTIDGQESILQADGTKQLVLLPMMAYTIISTMLEKLKYLPKNCFNRIVIGETPVCGLRPLTRTSPPLMYKLTEILRTIVDGVRKQQILSVTIIFYKKNDINTIYDSYSIVLDYAIKLPDDESTTSITMIANIIHQIEYMFSWNDALPNDVELTFVLSALDQFDNMETKVPKPFCFVKENVKNVYTENQTNNLLGRLTTPDGKIWLKFLPSNRQLSGSSIHSDDLPTKANLFDNKQKTEIRKNKKSTFSSSSDLSVSPKLKRSTKKIIEPDLLPSTSTKTKRKTGLLSAVKSLITPFRAPAPITSSTPNAADLVLVRHTSTPKPGETASRISIGDNEEILPLSTIYEVSTPVVRPPANINSPTPSTITATDISTANTPMIAVERRSTVRGQAAAARKKIASMQLEDDQDDNDDDDEDDEEQFKTLFTRRKPKKSKDKAKLSKKKSDNLSDISTISLPSSNPESIFTPPTARKRVTADRMGEDDLAAELSTPPKTPRTGRRNRIDDQISIQLTMMDNTDSYVSVDSPRLLRSVAKKLQQQASAKKNLSCEEDAIISDQSQSQNPPIDEEEMDCAYVNLERSSIALHYSMEESD